MKQLQAELGVWAGAPEKFAFLTLNYAICSIALMFFRGCATRTIKLLCGANSFSKGRFEASLSYEKDKYLASQFSEKIKFQLRKFVQFCKIASLNAKCEPLFRTLP